MGNRFGATEEKFGILRKRAKREAQAGTEQQKEALSRRFASLGMASSGEAIKQEQLAEQRGQAARRRATEAIDVAELGEKAQREAEERGRTFAREERVGAQQFAAGEALKGREFSAEQAGINRLFQSKEADKQRGFMGNQAQMERDLRNLHFNKNMKFRSKAFKYQKKLDAFQQSMATKRFDLDQEVTRFNMDIAQQEMGRKGFFERILFDPKSVMDEFSEGWGRFKSSGSGFRL